MKDKNDDIVKIMSEIKKNEEWMKMKKNFIKYFLGLSWVFILLLVWALVSMHVMK